MIPVFKHCFSTGVSSTYNVLQTPPSIIKKVGQSVSNEIHCSHDVSIFEWILWYKQDKHRAPQFLGYLNLNFPYPEEDVKGKIIFNGNGKEYSNLTISNVSVTDSAVYFCAASQHSTTDPTEATKGVSLKLSQPQEATLVIRGVGCSNFFLH
uniref:Ig-like domain-containing protein n=1 Tax=Maylandia zebra TaxID=106582 RepID=A0A3P9BZG9_9CICH